MPRCHRVGTMSATVWMLPCETKDRHVLAIRVLQNVPERFQSTSQGSTALLLLLLLLFSLLLLLLLSARVLLMLVLVLVLVLGTTLVLLRLLQKTIRRA